MFGSADARIVSQRLAVTALGGSSPSVLQT